MWRIIIVAMLLGGTATASGHKTLAGGHNNDYMKPVEVLREDVTDVAVGGTTLIAATRTTALVTTGRPTLASSNTSPTPSQSSTTPPLSSTATTSEKPSNKPSPQPIKDEELPLPVQEITGEPVVAVTTPAAPQAGEETGGEDAGKRRIVTYDQRQEGQYNIRADLENFIIVLIPPTPAEGINILDVLTKSTFRRSSSTLPGKPKRRLDLLSGTPETALYQQSLKRGSSSRHPSYLQREVGSLEGFLSAEEQEETVGAHQHYQKDSQQLRRQQGGLPSRYSSSRATVTTSPSAQLQELLGGAAAPLYQGDLSSSSDSGHSRLQQPDRQVDVLPPSYPLAYQHLIKPYHLEAEPTVIQAIPPAGMAQNSQSTNDFLATYNQLLTATSVQDRQAGTRTTHDAAPESDFYRVSRDFREMRAPRAVRSDSLLDANSVVSSSNRLLPGPEAFSSMYARSASHLPIFRADLSFGSRTNYPPIDVPRLADYLNAETNSRTLALNSAEERELEEGHVGEIIVPAPAEDELDLDLNSAGFLDSEAKGLLSDGLERCAPGRRRDSYGVCREIEGY